jgi:hypothetical protein
MGLKFEAIVLPGRLDEVYAPFCKVATTLTFDLKQVGVDWSVLLRRERDHAPYSEEVDHVAALLSESLGKALVVRWNTTVGHRAANFYVSGELSSSFGEDDEQWVLYDENGELTTHPTFHIKELDPDTEYDRLKSAADFGFEALGRGTSSELQDAIAIWGVEHLFEQQ